jgi:hypothetical protein
VGKDEGGTVGKVRLRDERTGEAKVDGLRTHVEKVDLFQQTLLMMLQLPHFVALALIYDR